MAYDIQMVKLITGETVLGKYNADKKTIDDPAILQTIPTQQGAQMMILPYGYPFDAEFTGSIATEHIIYTFKNTPEDVKIKYLEACSNLSLSSGGLGNLDLTGSDAAESVSSLLLGK